MNETLPLSPQLLAGKFEGGSGMSITYNPLPSGNPYYKTVISFTDTCIENVKQFKTLFRGTFYVRHPSSESNQEPPSASWILTGHRASVILYQIEQYTPRRKPLIDLIREIEEKKGKSGEQKIIFERYEDAVKFLPPTQVYDSYVINPDFLSGILISRAKLYPSPRSYKKYPLPTSPNFSNRIMVTASENIPLLEALQKVFNGYIDHVKSQKRTENTITFSAGQIRRIQECTHNASVRLSFGDRNILFQRKTDLVPIQ